MLKSLILFSFNYLKFDRRMKTSTTDNILKMCTVKQFNTDRKIF